MIDRVYVEIGNICNLKCSFCPGTKRAPRQMTAEEFDIVCKRLVGYTENLYFHVMGEPLLHPKLGELLKIAEGYGYKVSITTNGTLIHKAEEVLLENASALHRISISLHAPEGNDRTDSVSEYLDRAITFADKMSKKEVSVVYRLWNLDTDEKKGNNSQNEFILGRIREAYPEEWTKRYSGYRLAYRVFLEFDGIFTWPSESCAEGREEGRCHAMSRQIAVLADGSVVPCCLDSEGEMHLGNIFDEELDGILSSERAIKISEGFRSRRLVHPLCKKCTYSRRFD